MAPPVVPGFLSFDWLAAVPQKWGFTVFVVVCLTMPMENDPQKNVDAPADDELSDEALGDVSGAGVSSAPKK